MKILKKVLLLLLALSILFPFLYAISASFFTSQEFTVIPGKLLPSKLKLTNYVKVFSHKYYISYLVNSIITGFLGTFLRIFVSFIAAFSFSHFTFKLRDTLFSILLLTLFIPSDLLLVENYILIQRANLLDSYLGIISTSILSASQIFILRQFFLQTPKELHDNATLDGCNDFTYIRKILFPISHALLITLSLQSFVNIFNSYLWPLLVTNKPRMRTIQVGITTLGFEGSLNHGPTIAAIVMLFIPFLILLIISRRTINRALTRNYLYT